MRHLYGSVLAVVLAAVMFFAGRWGYRRLLEQPAGTSGGSPLSNSTLVLALAALLATGVLTGLLVAVRWFSPLAAGLPGLLLLAWTGLYLASAKQAVRLIPLRSDAFGAGWKALLFHGLLGAAGAVLVVPLFVPARWRSRRSSPDGLDTLTREADNFLADVGVSTGRAGKHGRTRAPRPDRAPALVGTVLPRRSTGGFPQAPADTGSLEAVDTTRITGASRVLRTTGSFRAATGNMPRYSAGWQDVDRPGYDQGHGDNRDD